MGKCMSCNCNASNDTPVPVSGAGFESTSRQLRAADFGVLLPAAYQLHGDARGQWQRVMLETLAALEEASATGRYHRLVQPITCSTGTHRHGHS